MGCIVCMYNPSTQRPVAFLYNNSVNAMEPLTISIQDGGSSKPQHRCNDVNIDAYSVHHRGRCRKAIGALGPRYEAGYKAEIK